MTEEIAQKKEPLNLNIQVDLSSLFTFDEDGTDVDFNQALRNQIIYNSEKQVREKVIPLIEQLVLQQISNRLPQLIESMCAVGLENIHQNQAFKKQYGGEITLDEVILRHLNNFDWDHRCVRIIKDHAELFTKHLKETYDQRFAAGIVEGLNKQGLLNSDAAKALFSNNSKS